VSEYCLVEAEVVLGDDLRSIRDADVHVRDGKIISAGRGAAPEGVPAIDLSGRLVLPGFVNAHTHIADAAVKEVAFNSPPGTNIFFPPNGLRYTAMAAVGRETRIAAIRSAARQMIASGVVAFADFTAGGVEGVRELREALGGVPIRGLSFGGFDGVPQRVEELEANEGGLSPRVVAQVIETMQAADGFAPVRASDLTDHAMSELRALAYSNGKPLATHAAATPSYREVSVRRTGKSDIPRVAEHLKPDFLVHLTAATDDELRVVAEHNIPIVMCPRANVSLGAGAPPYFSARALGATIALGTDNLMLGSPDILAEMNFLALMLRSASQKPAVIDERALLHAATLGGARAIGIDDTLGSIAPGKSASLVVIDLRRDNLKYSTNPIASLIQRATIADIEAVIIDGEVVHGAL
jgi:cytosine/adenosine deaminase-related metal-dependent hydrolase